MSGVPRRSARIAEQRAVAEAEAKLPSKVDETDVEEGSSDSADEDAGSGGQDDHDLTPKVKKVKKVDDKSAEALLKDHELYGPTKDQLPGSLPLPFRLANPFVLKEPRLWPLLFEDMQLQLTDLTTKTGLDGDVTKAFTEAFYECYRRLPPAEVVEKCRATKQIFKACAMCFIGVCGSMEPWRIFDALGVFVTQATEAFDALDERLVAVTAGGRAASAFANSRKFDLLYLPGRSKNASSAAARVSAKGQKCNRCEETFYGGSFRDHRCSVPGYGPHKGNRDSATEEPAKKNRRKQ